MKVGQNILMGVQKAFEKIWRGQRKIFLTTKKVTFVEYRNPEDVNEALNNLQLIESQAWKSQTGIQIDDEHNNHFYFELAKVISQKNWLRIWVLKVDEIPVAYDYHVDYFGNIKTLKGSYDKTFAEFSPGSLLSWKVHQLFFQEGAEGVDLLWGNLDYKQKWTNFLNPHYEIAIYNSNFYSRFIKFRKN